LSYCSFQQLEIPGAHHSGDVRSAPYPTGGRESVSLDLDILTKTFPTCRYIVILMYVYNGSLNGLHDASAFVGNPQKAGTGPYGIELISAANLSGNGRTNICGFISIENDRQYFYCVDHMLNVKQKIATEENIHIKTICGKIVNGEINQVNVRTMAALYSSAISDEVHIVHHDGILVLRNNEHPNNRYSFFNTIENSFKNLKTAIRPIYIIPEREGIDSVFFCGGELMDGRLIASHHTSYAKKGKLTVVNLLGEANKENIVSLPIGSVRMISGCNIFDILNR